jgi:succinate dehydrogenase/fumarate reductase flavoprotein subunit
MPASISPASRSRIIATAGFDAGVDHERIGLRLGHQAVDRHVVAGRRAGHDADAPALQARILQGINAVEAVASLEHERVGRAVVRVRDLNEIISLGAPMMTSHLCAASVLRTKPVACGYQA